MIEKLKLLEEEEPTIHTVWNEQTGEIMLSLMGRIGTDILTERISYLMPSRYYDLEVFIRNIRQEFTLEISAAYQQKSQHNSGNEDY